MKTAVAAKYRIEQDDNPESPAKWEDENLFLVANHSQFYVPAPGEKAVPQHAKEVVDKWKKTHWVFPVEAYIHSGVSLALAGEGSFPDRQWDVSQIGFVFVSKLEWRLSKSARKCAVSYLETWNTYLSGDVWGFIIEDEDGNEIHSCWGFYGKEHCEEEAKASFASYSE
jgi:hypothetical protein